MVVFIFSDITNITVPILPYFTGSDSSFLSISLHEWPSVRVGVNFFIYSLIQFFKMLAGVRNDPKCVCDFMFKTTNKRTIHCSWFYCSYFTQNFKLVNPFYNFLFHRGIFKFLYTNCRCKLSMSFIGDLTFGSRNCLNCSMQCIWLNHKPFICWLRVTTTIFLDFQVSMLLKSRWHVDQRCDSNAINCHRGRIILRGIFIWSQLFSSNEK